MRAVRRAVCCSCPYVSFLVVCTVGWIRYRALCVCARTRLVRDFRVVCAGVHVVVPVSQHQGRGEDSLLAYSFKTYVYETPDDPEWVVLLPMAKASIRALDTIADYAGKTMGMHISVGRVSLCAVAAVDFAARMEGICVTVCACACACACVHPVVGGMAMRVHVLCGCGLPAAVILHRWRQQAWLDHLADCHCRHT